MNFAPRAYHSHPDPDKFPPARGAFEISLEGVKIPDFITDEKLRKGPRQQNTLTWMNAVQTCLDENTSWDCRLDGSIGVRIHEDVKACQVARISSRSLENCPMKSQSNYIREDIQPAIDMLVLEAEVAKKTGDRAASKKRRQEDEAEIQQAAKKRKQDADKKLTALVDELQALRKLVDEKMDTVDIEIRRQFHKLEGQILELMAAEP